MVSVLPERCIEIGHAQIGAAQIERNLGPACQTDVQDRSGCSMPNTNKLNNVVAAAPTRIHPHKGEQGRMLRCPISEAYGAPGET